MKTRAQHNETIDPFVVEAILRMICEKGWHIEQTMDWLLTKDMLK